MGAATMTVISNRRQMFEDALGEYRAGRIREEFPAYLLDDSVSFDDKLDAWESFVIDACEPLECPLDHTFPDGLYVRKITMPAGSIITSRIHNFDNPFFILKGKVIVVSENEGQVIYEKGDSGVTKPNTRRLLLVLQETIWTTVHPNPDNSEDVPQLVDHLTYVRPHIKGLEVAL